MPVYQQQALIPNIKQKKAKPFLKWAGGKSQLLSQFEDLYPPELKQGQIDKYVEPFVGSGAVFFEIVQKYPIKSVYLYDINVELILVYKVIQQDPTSLIEQLDQLSRKYKALGKAKEKNFFIKSEKVLTCKSLKLILEILLIIGFLDQQCSFFSIELALMDSFV